MRQEAVVADQRVEEQRIGVDVAFSGPAALDVAVGENGAAVVGDLSRQVAPEDTVDQRRGGIVAVYGAAGIGRVSAKRAVDQGWIGVVFTKQATARTGAVAG